MSFDSIRRKVLQRKVEIFSAEAMLDKLLEEIDEARIEVVKLRQLYADNKTAAAVKVQAVKMIEELADVHITGYLTMTKLYPWIHMYWNSKIRRSILIDIPRAIAQALDPDRWGEDGEPMDDNPFMVGDGDA